MNKTPIFFLFFISTLNAFNTTAQDSFPQAVISNGIVKARFYLPDAEKGYYRGTRFDWSGNMPELEYKTHTYCTQWFDNYNATTHDAIMGPVESFAPLGYEAAATGGHFVELGVGILTKPTADPYSPFKYYPIVNNGKWKIKTKASSIEFTHTLQDDIYPYTYVKTETLVKGKPVLLITHSLTNTGKQIMETSVYNHNLFVFDKQPTGPAFTTEFPFTLTGDARGQRGFAADPNNAGSNTAGIKDNKIIFNIKMPEKENVYSIINGFGESAKDYDIKIENHQTGAAVRITSDRPMSKLAFWGNTRIFSPEPFIHVRVLPGETFSWTISYELYTCTVTH